MSLQELLIRAFEVYDLDRLKRRSVSDILDQVLDEAGIHDEYARKNAKRTLGLEFRKGRRREAPIPRGQLSLF